MNKRTKAAGEVITYRVDFARALEDVWQPGREYANGDYARPSMPNGFEYQASGGAAVQSAQDEPAWPITIGETIDDGSVTWTATAFGFNASDTVASRIVTVDPGLTIDASGIDGTRVNVTVSGGSANKVYDLQVEIQTTAGDEYAETIRITVTE